MNKKTPPLSLTPPETSAGATDEIYKVLMSHGHEAGQFSVLGPDGWKVIWNEERSGFIAFLEGRRSLITWRSPVAEPADQPELLGRLVAYASEVRKPFVAVEVNEISRSAGEALGMTPMWTGAESFLDLPTWSLAGGRRQKVRWARSHAAKQGVRWREAHPFTNRSDFEGMARVEESWKEQRTERRTDSFLRTSFAEIGDLRRYFVCEGAQGIIAFVTCTPVNQNGWYLQDIVRLFDAPRGALEGAMALALDTFRDEGFAFASNGPLPFWRPNEQWTDPHQLGAVGNRVLRFFDRQYRFRGINQFRSKFEADRTIPLYVLRTRGVITPRVARSLIQLLNTRSA